MNEIRRVVCARVVGDAQLGAKALKQQECQDRVFHKSCGYLVRGKGEKLWEGIPGRDFSIL